MHQEFQFPLLDAAHCETESEHQVSNGSMMGLFLREYWTLVPNNNNIHGKETKIWLSFKTFCPTMHSVQQKKLKLFLPVLYCYDLL